MNEIFSHFIARDAKTDQRRVGYIMWFSDTFPDSEFKGEDLLMKMYCNYSTSLQVPLKYNYLAIFISTELRRILIEENIHVPGTDNLNYSEPTGLETAYQVTREYLLDQFRLLESKDVDIDDFKVEADSFMTKQLNDRMVEELGRTYETLSATENSREAIDYALDNLIILRDIYDKAALEDLNDGLSDALSTFEFVCDTGMPVIDNDIEGIHTCQLFGIEAQPGTGKSRFALGTWAYRCAVLYKQNVIYYQLEQSEPEARAMLVARHVFTLYNIQISDSMILFNRVPEELKSKVTAAEIDLFESGKYGKIYINRTDLYVETLTQVFRKDDKLHGPFKMIIIDYMGLIQSRGSKYQRDKLEYQIINEAFRKYKNYVEHTKRCGIAVSQFNDKGIQAGEADKDITTNMAQGGIAVYRHTDQNLALSRTKVMEAQQKLRISQPKIRGTAGFGSIVVDTRLGFSYIYQNQISQV